MSFTLVPRCCASRAILTEAQQPLKGLTAAGRPWQTGHPTSRSAASISAPAHHASVRPYDEIPGPKPLPIVGNSWRFLPLIGEYAFMQSDDLHRSLYAKYGPIVKVSGIMGRRDSVFIFRPEDVEATLRNEGPWPYREGIKSMEYYRQVHRKDYYQGAGSVLTDQGSKWGETRSKVNQPMMQPRISRKYVPPIAGVAHDFVDMVRGMRDDKDEVPPDFDNELFKWALESIAFVALDARLGCLKRNLAPDSEQQRIINAVHTILHEMYALEFGLQAWKIFPTPTWRKFVKAQDTLYQVSIKYIQAAVDRLERRKREGEVDEDPSVLERLLERADGKTATLMAQDMLFAGIDTTSYSTATVMYNLSKNKDKQEALFGEVKRFLSRKDTQITEEMLEEMKYLKAVIKESMRLDPLVVWNMRKTVKDIVLSNYIVPEGVDVIMPNLMYRSSEEIYPQGKRFIPERWLKRRPSGEDAGSAEDFDAVNKAKANPFAFLPFGFGPRTCVGKRFADLEMEILLAKMVRNFKIDYKYGEMRFASRLINTPQDPLRFQLKDRSE